MKSKNVFVGALLAAGLFGLFFGEGCVSVEYTGAEYPPTDSVAVLDCKTVPEGYEPIGKAVAKASSEQYSKAQIVRRLVEKAKAEGADALFVSCFEKAPARRARIDEVIGTDQGDENLGWGLDDNFEGDIRQIDYDFVETTAKEQTVQTYDTIVKAVFLRKKP